MPLIRYRTGDLARFVPHVCPCGSSLRLLAPVAGRRGEAIQLSGGVELCIAELDDWLLGLDGVADFVARVVSERGHEALRDRPSDRASVRAGRSGREGGSDERIEVGGFGPAWGAGGRRLRG